MENYNVNYSVHLPSYSIGPDCYNEVPYVTRFFGKTAVVLGGETAMEKAKPALLKGVEGSDVELLGFLPTAAIPPTKTAMRLSQTRSCRKPT